METSCQIAFEFVDQEQLVSYDYLQGPCASLCTLLRVGIMWENEGRDIPKAGQDEGVRSLGAQV